MNSEFSKSVATLLVVSLCENLLGASRACEDFAYRDIGKERELGAEAFVIPMHNSG